MQNKVLFLLILAFFSISIQAQRGVRIGYIDTEYILENVPEYQEAIAQLNEKADKWKNEIEVKLGTIEQQRKDLSNEKALLTKELIEEREEDIYFEEKEILDYQQKRFGPNGDLFIQQTQLMKPVQDQIFAAVQDIANSRKYDFIFDKSSDATMLFSARQYDLSETVIRSITRTAKRKQVQSKSERKAAEEEELVPEINLEQEERARVLEEKKKQRESAIEEARNKKLAAREAKVKEAEAKRQKILDDREKAKQAKIDARNKVTESTTDEEKTGAKTVDEEKTGAKTREQLIEENRQKKLAEREERKRALEEKKKKILAERQKELEDRKKARDSINQNN
ncbi:OmpH family outer membrane protein [Seonamhaeicola maritimus]|uniref:OmpH family outer membrane protein n=1 Tax=Seonamhaeicola maritimus TaxID=2591822 RepID=A0A5C7GJM6_9FLAO|nr:OmpH family outer membrane protein [Seonamhaeicola maritimus]TXG38337.1 OmpH family outer membrane protein [Seonamhaeicola maritimus]